MLFTVETLSPRKFSPVLFKKNTPLSPEYKNYRNLKSKFEDFDIEIIQ